jgi:hypothetical protein
VCPFDFGLTAARWARELLEELLELKPGAPLQRISMAHVEALRSGMVRFGLRT